MVLTIGDLRPHARMPGVHMTPAAAKAAFEANRKKAAQIGGSYAY